MQKHAHTLAQLVVWVEEKKEGMPVNNPIADSGFFPSFDALHTFKHRQLRIPQLRTPIREQCKPSAMCMQSVCQVVRALNAQCVSIVAMPGSGAWV